MAKRLLLINPWICDFTAHDLWIKPLGLLHLAAILEKNGCQIDFIDCLDRHNPELLKIQKRRFSRKNKYGCGKYFKSPIEKPASLKQIPRLYGRYGISPEIFCRELKKRPLPDAVLVTSAMTYWYPGVFEIIRLVRDTFPGVPVILGGIYASLCSGHARKYSGADLVVTGTDVSKIVPSIMEYTRIPANWIPANLNELPYPAYHVYPKLDYACLLTSQGCPFSCSYCASKQLNSSFEQREPGKVVDEIEYFHKKMRARNFAFYDDALLANSEEHIIPILDGIIERSIIAKFHIPNAMHAKFIDRKLARKMFKAGFKTIRLGLETSNSQRQKEFGGKVNNGEFEAAVLYLKEAGYKQSDIGAYILVGMPEQSLDEVMESVAFAFSCGAKPIFTEYSPLPGTSLFEDYRSLYSEAIEEPLLHNNSLLGYYPYPRPDLLKLKYLIKTLNFGLQQGINLFDDTELSRQFSKALTYSERRSLLDCNSRRG